MSTKANVEDIKWSRQHHTLRQAIRRCTFPQLMKVVQGYESSDDTETLARDQVLRINQIHTQTRVLATTDKKGRWLSIPLRYAEARFEIFNGNKRSKPMYMREIIDKSLLPQKVQFCVADELTFDLQMGTNTNNNTKEKFGTLVLQKMYETAYLQGNAIHNNHLDTMVLNIPIHSPVEVVLAEGFIVGSMDRWERYQTLLDKIVSKNVSYELHPGNPHITYFTDKKMEQADLQEHYEQIVPAGTLFVSTKNDRLREKKGPGNMLPGPSGARTVSAASASRSKSPEFRIEQDNASVQTAGNERQSRPVLRHAKSEMDGQASFMTHRPRMMSPTRTPRQSVHGTMPRSILKKEGNKQVERFPPPPDDFLVKNPMAYLPDNRPQSPPPQQGVRRRTSHSPGRAVTKGKSPVHVDYPRPVNSHLHNENSPKISPSSQHSSGDSGYSSTSSRDAFLRQQRSNQYLGDLPPPDYDADQPNINGGGYDSTDFASSPASRPPDPPPLSTMPSKRGMQNGSQSPRVSAPAAPPPPPVGAVPPPPSYNAVAQIRANSTTTNTTPLKREPSRDDVMQELKRIAERRLSKANGADNPITLSPSSVSNRSPRTINNNKDNSGNELQQALAKRKSLIPEENQSNPVQKTPPPPAAKPNMKQTRSEPPVYTKPVTNKFGNRSSAKSSEVTFVTLAEVPKDLNVLSVSQVCQCLKLMNLDKYSGSFQSNSVDGQLMLQLNKDALKDSFKMSDWDAQRVESFIKGWRPKY